VCLQLLYGGLLLELDRHFRAMQVRYMPMKGAFLILSGLAEKIPARNMVDVDILVEEENFQRVRDYFSACPQLTVTADPWPFEFGVQFPNFGHEPLFVEVHHRLNRPERFHLPTGDLFARGEQKGPFLWLPSLEDGLVIAICHSLVHIGWGHLQDDVFGDIEVLTGCPTFSWQRFEAIMATTEVRRFADFLFLIYEKRRGCKLRPDSHHSLMVRILAAAFGLCYRRVPVPLMRALFELSFVRDPVGLIRASRAAAHAPVAELAQGEMRGAGGPIRTTGRSLSRK
jgi:hypothetical protein